MSNDAIFIRAPQGEVDPTPSVVTIYRGGVVSSNWRSIPSWEAPYEMRRVTANPDPGAAPGEPFSRVMFHAGTKLHVIGLYNTRPGHRWLLDPATVCGLEIGPMRIADDPNHIDEARLISKCKEDLQTLLRAACPEYNLNTRNKPINGVGRPPDIVGFSQTWDGPPGVTLGPIRFRLPTNDDLSGDGPNYTLRMNAYGFTIVEDDLVGTHFNAARTMDGRIDVSATLLAYSKDIRTAVKTAVGAAVRAGRMTEKQAGYRKNKKTD